MRSPATYLLRLLESHGVNGVVREEWVVPDGRLPALRATWQPGPTGGRLDIHALVSDGVMVEESFAGLGAGEDGLRDGFENFARNSFHVMLAALWARNDPEQVTTEAWVVNGKRYVVYIGNFGGRASHGLDTHVPEGLFAGIEAAILAEPLTADLHWFRLFFCNVSGAFTFEALKDNEDWAAGVRCLQSAPWEVRNGYYSTRLFMMLRAAAAQE